MRLSCEGRVTACITPIRHDTIIMHHNCNGILRTGNSTMSTENAVITKQKKTSSLNYYPFHCYMMTKFEMNRVVTH